MSAVRAYRMTISSTWYDGAAERVREFEMHFKVTRRGSIITVRRQMSRRGVPYFQQTIYRQHRRWIPKRKIRVSFEREEPALQPGRTITIDVRGMEGRGRRWKAFPMPSRTLSYTKRRRKPSA